MRPAYAALLGLFLVVAFTVALSVGGYLFWAPSSPDRPPPDVSDAGTEGSVAGGASSDTMALPAATGTGHMGEDDPFAPATADEMLALWRKVAGGDGADDLHRLHAALKGSDPSAIDALLDQLGLADLERLLAGSRFLGPARAHIEARCLELVLTALVDPAADPDDLLAAVAAVARFCDEKTRKTLIAGLQERFLADGSEVVPDRRLATLGGTLCALDWRVGKRCLADHVTVERIRAAPLGDQVALVGACAARELGMDGAIAMIPHEQELRKIAAGWSPADCTPAQRLAAARIWSNLRRFPAARRWAAGALSDPTTRAAAARLLERLGGSAEVETTDLLVECAQAGDGYLDPAMAKSLGRCGTVDAQALDGAGRSADGRPSVAALQLAAWATPKERTAGRVDQLAGRAAAAEPERAARLLLGQAYAEEAHHAPPPAEPDPAIPDLPEPTPWTIHRFHALKRALAAAPDEATRLLVARHLAGYFRSRHRPGEGADLLASLAGGFSAGKRADLADLILRLRVEEDRRLYAEEQRW